MILKFVFITIALMNFASATERFKDLTHFNQSYYKYWSDKESCPNNKNSQISKKQF